MIYKFTLLFSLQFIFLWNNASSDDCLLTCQAMVPGSLIADPKNCTNYYTCLYDETVSDTPSTCEDGTYFDEDYYSPEDPCTGLGTCRPKCRKSACRVECDKNSSESIFLNSKSGVCGEYVYCSLGQEFDVECKDDVNEYFSFEKQGCTDSENDCCDPCIPYCEKKFEEVRNPSDCTQYYLCTEIGEILDQEPFDCPNEENFNPELGHCDENFKSCTPISTCN